MSPEGAELARHFERSAFRVDRLTGAVVVAPQKLALSAW
jgi:hypothetical protein